MGIAASAKDLISYHAKAGVRRRYHILLIDWFEETGPTGTRVKFSIGTKKRKVAADTLVEAGLLVVVESTAERPLGTFTTGDLIDFATAELSPPFLVGFGNFFHGLSW